MPTRILLIDDHEIVRRGLAEMFSLEDDLEVVGEASTVAEALHRIPAAKPDVAVLDVRLPDGTGVEVCREARSILPGLRALMLTSYSDDEALFDAIMAGASGYVLKDIRGNDLVDAVRAIGSFDDLKSMLLQREVNHFAQPFLVGNDQNFFHQANRPDVPLRHDTKTRIFIGWRGS